MGTEGNTGGDRKPTKEEIKTAVTTKTVAIKSREKYFFRCTLEPRLSQTIQRLLWPILLSFTGCVIHTQIRMTCEVHMAFKIRSTLSSETKALLVKDIWRKFPIFKVKMADKTFVSEQYTGLYSREGQTLHYIVQSV